MLVANLCSNSVEVKAGSDPGLLFFDLNFATNQVPERVLMNVVRALGSYQGTASAVPREQN